MQLSSNLIKLQKNFKLFEDAKSNCYIVVVINRHDNDHDLMCKGGRVGQSKGLLIPMSSVRFRLNPENSNSHGFELHRPSIKGTKLPLKVIKAIIII